MGSEKLFNPLSESAAWKHKQIMSVLITKDNKV